MDEACQPQVDPGQKDVDGEPEEIVVVSYLSRPHFLLVVIASFSSSGLIGR